MQVQVIGGAVRFGVHGARTGRWQTGRTWGWPDDGEYSCLISTGSEAATTSRTLSLSLFLPRPTPPLVAPLPPSIG